MSGVSTKLSERPEGKRLFDILRKGDVLIVRWIDRLGRNYKDVTDTIRYFISKGIIIKTVINTMTFDGSTTDPMQEAIRDALVVFMAAMASYIMRHSRNVCQMENKALGEQETGHQISRT